MKNLVLVCFLFLSQNALAQSDDCKSENSDDKSYSHSINIKTEKLKRSDLNGNNIRGHLSNLKSYIEGSNFPLLECWKKYRDLDTQYLLALIRKIKQTYLNNPNFDPEAKLPYYPPFPTGVNLPLGADPNLIKDKNLRQEYELALKKHKKEMDTRNRLLKVFLYGDLMIAKAENHLIDIYMYDDKLGLLKTVSDNHEVTLLNLELLLKTNN